MKHYNPVLLQSIEQFVYVDCGAQGDSSKPLLRKFPNSLYVGFDPGMDPSMPASKSNISFPVALGKENAIRDFYRTNNPNCSSFFLPNYQFLNRFMQVGDFFKIEDMIPLHIVELDQYLSENGISDVDFIELDTQGSELDILKGAAKFLSSSIVGVRVEVEFFPMYDQQPLFADVDSYLRQLGFMLFDLERYHLRRNSGPMGTDSREQLVWGQALYLRDFLFVPGAPSVRKQKLSKLSTVASYYGFHSYALEIMEYLTQEADLLTSEEKSEVINMSAQYAAQIQNKGIVLWMQWLDKSLFSKLFRQMGQILLKLCAAYTFITGRQTYFWRD